MYQRQDLNLAEKVELAQKLIKVMERLTISEAQDVLEFTGAYMLENSTVSNPGQRESV